MSEVTKQSAPMEQEAEQTKAKSSAGAPKSPSWRHPVSWFWHMQDTTSSAAPLVRTVWAVVLLIGGIGVNEAYGWVRGKFVDPDEFIKQMAAKQDQSFDELKKGLSQLSGAIDGADRSAVARIEAASREIRRSNLDLISQLDLAKQENSRLSKVAERQSGILGGYDFMLSEHAGMRIDKGVVLGVNSISQNYINAQLSADGAPDSSRNMTSGQSLNYRNASGAACKVTLLSISGSHGAASFSNSCT
jgi:hypothetical protein